jgi:cytochrome c oxidase assembly factor CtaG
MSLSLVSSVTLLFHAGHGASGFAALVSTWRTDAGGLTLTGIGGAVISAYLFAWATRPNKPDFLDGASAAAFFSGVLVFLWICCSGLGSTSERTPGVVVADHLALVTIVPVLIALGSPVRTVAEAVGRRRSSTKQRQKKRSGAAVWHPAIGLALLIGIEYVFLLSPLYGWALGHQSGGDLVRGAFLLAGCLYWWPIVGTDYWPRPMGGGARMIDLAATLPFTAFLGIDLTLTDRRLPASRSLEATHIAGAELWGYPTLFTVAALGAVFWWWMRQEDERAAAHDRGLDTIDAAEAIVRDAEFHLDDTSE